MSFPPRTRWLAPASMVLALGISVLLILGHHFFYSSLDGRPANARSFLGTSVTQQEANVAIGTAFAFVVKAFLVFAMSVAFAQVFWREAKHAVEPPTLAKLDGMHAAFDSVLSLGNLILWFKFPLLLGLAGCAWIVPIASIIAPATLSIQDSVVVPAPTTLLPVPTLDFLSLNYLSSLPYGHSNTEPDYMASYLYNGPSQDILEVSNAVMSGGKTLHIGSPAPNASWTIDFAGPSIQCADVDPGTHKVFQRNIVQGTLDATNGAMLYGYLSWYPRVSWWGDSFSTGPPFLAQTENGTLKFASGQFPGSTLDSNITFYVVAMPGAFGVNASALHSLGSPGSAYPSWIDGTMLACTLYSTTYRAAFRYENGTQHITTTRLKAQTRQDIVKAQVTVAGPNPLTHLDGCANASSIPASTTTAPGPPTSTSSTASCYNDPKVLSTLAYQAVLDAFTSNLVGSISIDGFSVLQRHSSVLSTTLLSQTHELAFLQARASNMVDGNITLQAQVPNSQQIPVAATTTPKIPLARAIEDMFQNFTLSLMADSPTTTQTTVTLPASRNIYSYSAFKLWAAYGTAVFLATLAVAIGLITIWLNGVSYSHNFSTVFRVARGADISRNLREEDMKGEDPLPEHLVDAEVRFDVGKGDGEGEEEVLRYRRQDSRFKT